MTHFWKNIHQVLKDKGLEIQNIQKSFRERKAGSKHDRQNQLRSHDIMNIDKYDHLYNHFDNKIPNNISLESVTKTDIYDK
jgi:hypothetical protein